MEKAISQEERIRRAEEIYYKRRKQNGIRVSTNNVNKNEKIKISLFKKMLLQIAICIVIYIIFYLIKNSNYIFSDDVISKTKEFLSYDINFESIQNSITSFIEENKDKFSFLGIFEEEEEEQEQDEESEEDEDSQSSGIGGSSEEEDEEENEDEDSDDTKTQEEEDIEYVKSNFDFVLPVTGTVTSRYGTREATETVSANHKGIDIGAEKGTAIYAAMDGVVTVSSSEGDYGKHIDIENEDVLTRYAHCSKLLVEEGDEVKKGDKIAEVGSTGNSTGPHLHFEIRRDGRTIDPEAILDFD